MELGSCFNGLVIDAPVYAAAATAGGLVVLALWIARHDFFFGRAHFLAAVGGMVWWLAIASLELATPLLDCKVLFATVTWPAIAIVPVSWCFFMLHFCLGMRRSRPRAEALATAGIVAVVAAIALSNPWHGLFYGPGTTLVVIDGRLSGAFDHGPLFYGAASLLYIFLTASLVIAAAGAFAASRERRPMLLMLLFGTAVPMTANFAYVALDVTVFGFDPTPFAFAFILLVFTWSIYTNRSFDLTTVARDLLYFNSAEPVIVVNDRGQVAGVNPAGRALMPALLPGTMLDTAGPLGILAEVARGTGGTTARRQVTIGDRMLDLRAVPIPRPLSEGGACLGAVAIMADVTELQRNATHLAAALDRSRAQVAEITRLRERAELSALSDPLTELGNRRSLALRFEALGNAPLALALIDIDHFKQINDRLGHAVGDRVLRMFAAAIRSVLPPDAEAFRVGGEEFLVLCPGLSTAAILAMLNRLAQSLADEPPLREHDHPRLTFSAGVAVRPGDGDTHDQLYARADARLYEAKRSGRNRIMHLDGMPFDTSPASGGVGNVGRSIHG